MQTETYRLVVDQQSTEINAQLIETFTTKAPLAGWIVDARVKIEASDLEFSFGTSVVVTTKEDWGEISDVFSVYKQSMNGWRNTQQVYSYMASNAPMNFYIPGHSTGEGPVDGDRFFLEKRKKIGELVSRGDNINVIISLNNTGGGTHTTGRIEYTVEFTFLVGHLEKFNQNPELKASKVGGQVIIMATMDNTGNIAFWTPPGKGKVMNVRLTMFGGAVAADQNSNLYFGEGLFTDNDINHDEIYSQTEGLSLESGVQKDEDHWYITNYQKNGWTVRSGSMLKLMYTTDSVTDIKVLVEFDFIPEWKSQQDWNMAWELDDLDQAPKFRTFMLPFDVFVQDIHVSVRLSDTSIEGDLRFQKFEDLPEIFSTLTPISGSIIGTSGVGNGIQGILPSNVLITIALSASAVLPAEGIRVPVFQYFKAGSFLTYTIDLESSSATEDIDLSLNVNAFSRVSRSAKSGTNYFMGEHVLNLEAVTI